MLVSNPMEIQKKTKQRNIGTRFHEVNLPDDSTHSCILSYNKLSSTIYSNKPFHCAEFVFIVSCKSLSLWMDVRLTQTAKQTNRNVA